jgi:hypothetical protein
MDDWVSDTSSPSGCYGVRGRRPPHRSLIGLLPQHEVAAKIVYLARETS